MYFFRMLATVGSLEINDIVCSYTNPPSGYLNLTQCYTTFVVNKDYIEEIHIDKGMELILAYPGDRTPYNPHEGKTFIVVSRNHDTVKVRCKTDSSVDLDGILVTRFRFSCGDSISTTKECSCSIQSLMANGCNCGAIKRYERK